MALRNHPATVDTGPPPIRWLRRQFEAFAPPLPPSHMSGGSAAEHGDSVFKICHVSKELIIPGNRAGPFQLPRVIILIESLYDELSAALDGVGELRLMTLGNQGSS